MTMAVAINLMTVAFALPWFMGQKISIGARRGQQFLMLQGLTWILILGSSRIQDPIGSSVLALVASAMAMIALWRLSRALRAWLGPRPAALRNLLAICCALGPLGFAIMQQSTPDRTHWFSASYGAGLILVGCMALRPAKAVAVLWRYILFGMCFIMGLLMLTRSYITIAWLQRFAEESHINTVLTIAAPAFSTLTLLVILMAWRDETQRRDLEQNPDDPLTGLPHRYALMHQAQDMLQRSQRNKIPLSMLLLDIDQFKYVNQRRGYGVGNEALQLLSMALQKQIRGDEMAARWRGESFCLLVHADATGLQSLITRLKSAVQLGLQHELQLSLDFSIGCVHIPEVWDELTFENLVNEAIRALQKAKKTGLGGLKVITLQVPVQQASLATDQATQADSQKAFSQF